MKKSLFKRLAITLALFAMVFALAGCESAADRANREYQEAKKSADEARQEAIEANKRLRTLEALFGD